MRLYKFVFFIVITVGSLTSQSLQAQVFTGEAKTYDPVAWSGAVEQLSETTYALHFDAEVEQGWHIYSQYTAAGMPFRFDFKKKGTYYELEGAAVEGDTTKQYSDIFGEYETFIDGYTPRLTQKIRWTNPEQSVIKSVISYQVCDEVCIPQDFYVVHDLAKQVALVFETYKEFDAYGQSSETISQTKQLNDSFNDTQENKGLWTLFILSFGGGLLALLTPCVFPMIPMTIGFFTKQSKTRTAGIKNAIVYGLSIIFIYVVLGLSVVAIFGADALNALSTSVTFNLIFFVVLIIFAISFLGAFEIQLPNSWANKVDRQADRGGMVGIFFMALALAIVSFSCTGPIVGTTLVQASSKGGLAPVIGMLGFSSAIAIPFALFAMFPAWMSSLPKSGGWLNSVKVVLGFLELALAFKFLSNADLVLQAHLLERETFLAIIIAIGLGLVLYLFGRLKLPHDSDLNHLSVGRVLLGLVTLSFVIYLIPGLWGAPLKMISGFPPPMNYSESPYGVGAAKSGGYIKSTQSIPDQAELGPLDLLAFTDYEAGLAYAKEKNKPVLLDFTGVACINCRRMEERVWSDPKVLNLLSNQVILISLYADKIDELPESEQYISETTGKLIRTIGNKWSDFQIERYKVNAQPYYVLIDHDENNLNQPVGYLPDIDKYEAWLKQGIERFKSK
ncbi:MAG: thiol:disulfide interchange protein [Cytophagaceae bacterium]|nr:thiol:disulfide interchange protein [Cytophagaceae bacterium]